MTTRSLSWSLEEAMCVKENVQGKERAWLCFGWVTQHVTQDRKSKVEKGSLEYLDAGGRGTKGVQASEGCRIVCKAVKIVFLRLLVLLTKA